MVRQHLPATCATVLQDGADATYVTTSVVLRRLLKLGNTCKEMHKLVLDIGLPALARQVQPRFWERVGVASEVGEYGEKRLPLFWNTLVQQPTVCKLPDLKVQYTPLISGPLISGSQGTAYPRYKRSPYKRISRYSIPPFERSPYKRISRYSIPPL
jgi:hypothetical protein